MKGCVFESPIGRIGIWGRDGVVEEITLKEERDAFDEDAFLIIARDELLEYFAGKRKTFSFRYRLAAKGFQLACLETLISVPYGTTISYGELARRAGCPGGSRAVGNAMHRNPLPIRIPCHRVIRSDGELGGFGGGIEIKQYLLELEDGWQEE